ncbi:OLC1v1010093C4 [Oldenlandia corymbosa var. corymbosa]|uniref:OLC1v1010093C4 n=2 Tax=Oldenlandia corymbosa var. corymbosa TaxID=529605 RepID=A0AAV1DSX1_OLDCO|nr:OLC1v1010093C4 [Oldenlandia corymbosa var. corymbosa]
MLMTDFDSFRQKKKRQKIMSSSNSPCAACKCLRRKCTQECVFAPYFPPDQPQKFINVHKVFGASNVAKLLNELNAAQREDAVTSLAYEADYRLRDPVYGCVGLISILQHKLKQYQMDVAAAKKELATYIGPSAFLPIFQHPGFLPQQPYSNNPSGAPGVMPYNMHQPMMGLPAAGAGGVPPPHGGAQLMIREPQQQPPQQLYEAQAAQQYAAAVAAREQQQQEMYRAYEHQQQQQPQQSQLQQQQLTQDIKYNAGFDGAGQVNAATAYNQPINAAAMSPSLALGGTYEGVPYQIPAQQQQQPAQEHSQSTQQQQQYHQFQIQSQRMLQQQSQQQPAAAVQPQLQQMQSQFQPQTIEEQGQRAKSEEGRSACPSC